MPTGIKSGDQELLRTYTAQFSVISRWCLQGAGANAAANFGC